MTEKSLKWIIPSYKRPEIFWTKTLHYLYEHNINSSDIYLIIRSDDPEIDKYNNIPDINIIETEVKGIGMTHNFITETFNEGEYIVEIDDDLECLYDNHRQPIQGLKGIAETHFKLLEEKGYSYAGTYQVNNPMFMSQCEQYTTNLRYMLGCIRFRIVRKDIVLETNYAEDFENCILHYIRDGGILKNNWLAPKTKNYSPGGCDADGRDILTEKTDKEFLFNKYPDYCKLFTRKNGRYDLRLTHRP